MRTRAHKTFPTNTYLVHLLGAFRHTLRRVRAFGLWRAGGVSLLATWALVGLGVQLTVPPASANAAQLSGTISLSDVGGALAGATFNGIVNYDISGRSVSSAGDANGDGLDDLLIGAYLADAGGSDRGESYLVYGQSAGSPLTGSLNLSDVGGALAGATFNGIADIDYSGRSVSSAGDVNGDGLDDLLIGAYGANVGGSDRGESYLVYGQSAGSPLTGSLNLADVGGAVAGATFNGIADADYSGRSVSSAGDVNGDGFDDLLIGAYGANVGGNNRGESYLVYGQRYAAKWIDPGSDAWDDDLNWLDHAVPGSTEDVLIQPSIGLTVEGPAAATTVKSLTIGAQTAGTATLDLNSGTLNVTGQTTIEQRGTLTGSGIINLLGPISNAGEIELGNQGLQIAGGTLTNTGLIRGGGKIDNALVNSAGGEIHVGPGQRLHLTGNGAQTNAGRLDVVGNATQAARIVFDGTLTNAVTTGNITASYATMRFNDGLTNQGNMGISVGTSHIYGNIDNQLGAIISIQGNSTVTFWDDLTNNGTVQVTSGSTVAHFGTLAGEGSFTGGGTNFIEGGLSPGSSPGTMSFDGDLVLGSASTTLMELSGTSSSEYDRLLVSGDMTLGGNLEVKLIDGFTPEVGDTFSLLSSLTTGVFDTLNLPVLSSSLVWDLADLYTTGELLVSLSPLASDFDEDGDVDGFDFLTWQRGGSPTPLSSGDLSDWQTNYGTVAPLSAASAVVPEPSALLLGLMASLAGISRRRRR